MLIVRDHKIEKMAVAKKEPSHFVVMCEMGSRCDHVNSPWYTWLGSQCSQTPSAERERLRLKLSREKFAEHAAEFDYDWDNEDVTAGDYYDCLSWAETKAKRRIAKKYNLDHKDNAWICRSDCVCHKIDFPITIKLYSSEKECQVAFEIAEAAVNLVNSKIAEDEIYVAVFSFSFS